MSPSLWWGQTRHLAQFKSYLVPLIIMAPIPLTIIGVSYSVAAFPTLSRLFAGGEHPEFLRHLEGALRHIIFWSIPAMVFVIVLRAQLVRPLQELAAAVRGVARGDFERPTKGHRAIGQDFVGLLIVRSARVLRGPAQTFKDLLDLLFCLHVPKS